MNYLKTVLTAVQIVAMMIFRLGRVRLASADRESEFILLPDGTLLAPVGGGARDHARAFVTPHLGLDGLADETATATGYFDCPRQCYVRELLTTVDTDADFTTGDETALLTLDYWDGAAWVNVHTDAAAVNGSSFLADEPFAHTVGIAGVNTVRIPAASRCRVVSTLAGTTPIMPAVIIAIGLDPV